MIRLGAGRVASFALAVAAIVLVATMVPIRDRCWDPASAASTRTAVTRDASGCVLHVPSGAVTISAAACARLHCEPGLTTALARAKPDVLAALFFLYLIGTLAWAARWRALLGFAGVDLSVLQVWRISIEAQAGGVLLPGGIGGDALRIAYVVSRPPRAGQCKAPTAIVVASAFLDRAVGLALIAAAAASLGLLLGGPARGAGALIGVLTAIPIALIVGLVLVRTPALFVLPEWVARGRVGRGLGAVAQYLRDPRAPRAIATAAALSAIVALTQFAVIRGLVFAVGSTPSEERWVYVGAAMAFVVGALPGLPGAWGTADATYVFFFGLAGIDAGGALAVCLFFRLFWYLLGAAGGILHVMRPSFVTTAAAPKAASKT